MSLIEPQDESLIAANKTLTALQDAAHGDRMASQELSVMMSSVGDDFAKLRECRDNQTTARDFIARLEKTLAGWNAYLDYQIQREPGLEKRYELHKAYYRTVEDDQIAGVRS